MKRNPGRKRSRGPARGQLKRDQDEKYDKEDARNTKTTHSTSSSSPKPTKKKKKVLQPPPELVSLLQENPHVLHYFTDLQQKLQSDVSIWKTRAQHWQERCDLLEEEKTQWLDKKQELEKKLMEKNHKEEEESSGSSINKARQEKEQDNTVNRRAHGVKIQQFTENERVKPNEDDTKSGKNIKDGKDDSALSISSASNSDSESDLDTSTPNNNLEKKDPSKDQTFMNKATQKTQAEGKADEVDAMFEMALSSSSSSSASKGSHEVSLTRPQKENKQVRNSSKKQLPSRPRKANVSGKSNKKQTKVSNPSPRTNPSLPAAIDDEVENSQDEDEAPKGPLHTTITAIIPNRERAKTSTKVISQYQQLAEAHRCMHALGVALCVPVSQNGLEAGGNAVDEKNQVSSLRPDNHGANTSWKRVSDVEVASSLMRSLRALSRIHIKSAESTTCPGMEVTQNEEENSTGKESSPQPSTQDQHEAVDQQEDEEIRYLRAIWGDPHLPPKKYQGNDCSLVLKEEKHFLWGYPNLPCFLPANAINSERDQNTNDNKNHPAAEGLQLACRALSILATWSDPPPPPLSLEEMSSQVLLLLPPFQNQDYKDLLPSLVPILQTGYTQRRHLVHMLQQSIEGEAVRAWGCIDRAARWAADGGTAGMAHGLHHEMDEEDEEEEQDEEDMDETSLLSVSTEGNIVDATKEKQEQDQNANKRSRPPKNSKGWWWRQRRKNQRQQTKQKTVPPFGQVYREKNDLFHPSSTSENRLSGLVERCMHARLLASTCLFPFYSYGNHATSLGTNMDTSNMIEEEALTSLAHVLMHYILSTTPVLAVEERYSSGVVSRNKHVYAPVLSLCVVEAFLMFSPHLQEGYAGQNLSDQSKESKDASEAVDETDDDNSASFILLSQDKKNRKEKVLPTNTICEPITTSAEPSWFYKFLKILEEKCHKGLTHDYQPTLLLREALSFTLHAAASVWKCREQSSLARIRDVAAVEAASYERLVNGFPWLLPRGVEVSRLRHLKVEKPDGETEVQVKKRSNKDSDESASVSVRGRILVSEALGRLLPEHQDQHQQSSYKDGQNKKDSSNLPSSKCSPGSMSPCLNRTILSDAVAAIELVMLTLGSASLVRETCSMATTALEEYNYKPRDNRGSGVVPLLERCIQVIAACFRVQRMMQVVRMECQRVDRAAGAAALSYSDSSNAAGPLMHGVEEEEYDEEENEDFFSLTRDRLQGLLLSKMPDSKSSVGLTFRWILAACLSQCSATQSDGDAAFTVAFWVASAYTNLSRHGKDETMYSQGPSQQGQLSPNALTAMKYVFQTAEIPTLRIINLQRRKDRWQGMSVQAYKNQVLLVQAVIKLGYQDSRNMDIGDYGDHYSDDEHEESHPLSRAKKGGWNHQMWGEHAYDGACRPAELERQIDTMFGANNENEDNPKTTGRPNVNPRHISDLVESHWRPSRLKAVDINARGDGELVMMDPTERACALSHIASWKGVENSLHASSLYSRTTDDENKDQTEDIPGERFLYFEEEELFMRQFKISGYAKGPLLFSARNRDKSEPVPTATPVCVILEDDAVLVDRFSERLASVLEELPRDFHFCSLGYSRPKTAPMLPFGKHLGIPTFLWYLTGYVISLEGVKFLLESLPVMGPVDCWVGLRMYANWVDDSTVGSKGSSNTKRRGGSDKRNTFLLSTKQDQMHMVKTLAKLSHRTPQRKYILQKMKFRCFASLIPLCSQRIGVGSGLGSDLKEEGRVSWRSRDTDINYSGCGFQWKQSD